MTPARGGGGVATDDALAVSTPSTGALVAGFIMWALPVALYLAGIPRTQKYVACLKVMESGACEPFVKEWETIAEIGGVPGVLNHIQWGSPSLALYLAASFCLYPLQNASCSDKLGAMLNIPGGICLAVSLVGAFQVIGALFSHPGSQGSMLFFATLVLVITTLPFLQLITWQIEYGLRALLDKPNETILPNFLLWFVSKTNLLKLLVGLMTRMFQWSFIPEGFSKSGVEVVQSIADADYYSQEENASKLTAPALKSLNRCLLNQVLYGTLAVIPTWAVLTNFGMFPENGVAAPATRCIWSQMWTKLHPKQWDPASIGITGMVGPYWFLSFLWFLWGVGINQAYGGG